MMFFHTIRYYRKNYIAHNPQKNKQKYEMKCNSLYIHKFKTSDDVNGMDMGIKFFLLPHNFELM